VPLSRKILFLDIETLPDLIQARNHWPSLSNYPGTTFKGSLSSILCFGYKWKHEDEAKILNAWDYPEWHRDWRQAATLEEAVSIVNSDREMCQQIAEIIKEADAIVTHNGRKFDYKVLQTRMLLHKLPILPTNITHIDTKTIASSTFSFVNNRLATISRLLGGEEKDDSGGWDSWIEAWNKNPEILKMISDYCKQDVIATEAIYNLLHPAAKNVALIAHRLLLSERGLVLQTRSSWSASPVRIVESGVRLLPRKRGRDE
jgi:DNA polymerase elongation subunit (family B)